MTKHTCTAITLTVGLLAFTGCSKTSSVSQTHLATVAAGHKISADIDGVATIASQTDKAVITSQQFGEIVIEPSRVSLGSMKWTDIPDGAPITLNFSQNKQSVQWTTNQ